MKKIFAFSLIIILFLITSTCDRSPTSSKPDLGSTPMENPEAELAALWLSGDLVAPVKLHDRIRDELALIRSTWKDSIFEANIQFYPIWVASQLLMMFDDETYKKIESGLFKDWDYLNKYYRVNNIELHGHSIVLLDFEGRLNPLQLVNQYESLDGLEFVEPNNLMGDRPLLLIYDADSDLKYFFRNAWGDCPAGCINSTYNYFEVVDDSAIHRGSYYPSYPPNHDEAPVWYDTVLMARDNFYYQK